MGKPASECIDPCGINDTEKPNRSVPQTKIISSHSKMVLSTHRHHPVGGFRCKQITYIPFPRLFEHYRVNSAVVPHVVLAPVVGHVLHAIDGVWSVFLFAHGWPAPKLLGGKVASHVYGSSS